MLYIHETNNKLMLCIHETNNEPMLYIHAESYKAISKMKSPVHILCGWVNLDKAPMQVKPA